uniref:HSF-type DNA-binding domain-containing protein n=1 Tax=Globisporangium ultimum (strain ATCC 200006 / CBS 805.95 / DAOM BR144) TaxID=431595 RepID=K3WRA9_GLOUD
MTATTPTKVPKFLQSLYAILHDEDQNILTWSADGAYFQVLDVARLEREVLPKYFKHGKFTSFQRQLNNFSFRKWTKTRANVCTFSHDVLVRCAYPSQWITLTARYLALKNETAVVDASVLITKPTLKRLRSECARVFPAKEKQLKMDTSMCSDTKISLGDLVFTNANACFFDDLSLAQLCTLEWEDALLNDEAIVVEAVASTDLDCGTNASLEPLDWEVAAADCLVLVDHEDKSRGQQGHCD